MHPAIEALRAERGWIRMEPKQLPPLARRREAALRLPPLDDGRHDPLDRP